MTSAGPPLKASLDKLQEPRHLRVPPAEDERGTLGQRELEYYLFVVESSLQVRRTHQFHAWAQGALQSLLPHEILFCAHGDFGRRQFSVSRCTSSPFPERQFAEICDPEHGLVAKVVAAWRKSWAAPCLFTEGAGLHPQVESSMARHGFPHLACHGAHGLNGGGNTCFIFARFPRAPGSRQRYLLELLLPHLNAAFVRTLVEDPPRRDAPAASAVLTGREIEILHWVSEGKNNHQIGDALRISPLTVKNHVQNILRKLEVQNRAQAVSRAISLKLIGTQAPR